MEQRVKLLEEREQLNKEYTKLLKIQMDAFNKRNNLLPKFHVEPDGTEMATFIPTLESLSEYDKAEKEEREASAKLRELLQKIWAINAKLQS
jgi:hypothetical protein